MTKGFKETTIAILGKQTEDLEFVVCTMGEAIWLEINPLMRGRNGSRTRTQRGVKIPPSLFDDAIDAMLAARGHVPYLPPRTEPGGGAT